jgi:hypothetical protein
VAYKNIKRDISEIYLLRIFNPQHFKDTGNLLIN